MTCVERGTGTGTGTGKSVGVLFSAPGIAEVRVSGGWGFVGGWMGEGRGNCTSWASDAATVTPVL
jgi:hypothetical protein